MMMLLRRLLINLVWTNLRRFGLLNTIHFLINPILTISNTEVLIIFRTCYSITLRFEVLFFECFIIFLVRLLSFFWFSRCVTYYIMRHWTFHCLNWKVWKHLELLFKCYKLWGQFLHFMQLLIFSQPYYKTVFLSGVISHHAVTKK